jgi:hypothetical protein
LQPDLDFRRLFPDAEQGIRLSRRQLELFAEYWDDSEPEWRNVAAITRWLDLVDGGPEHRP